MLVEVDDSEFPLVCARLAGDVTDEEYAGWRDELDAIRVNAVQRYGLVVDATGAHVPTGRQFRMLATWIRDVSAELRVKTMVIAYVIPSPAVRRALKALFSLQALEVPYEIVQTYDEARTLVLRYVAREKKAVNT